MGKKQRKMTPINWEIGLLLREIEALKKRLDKIEYELSGQWYINYRKGEAVSNGCTHEHICGCPPRGCECKA